MSWLGSAWKIRRAIAVDNSASAGTTVDVSITIDPTDAAFWANIRSDGADLRVTLADGITLATFKRNSFTYSTKVLDIHVDNATVAANGVTQLWVYVGNASATDAVSVFTSGSLTFGYPFIGVPAQRIVSVKPQRPSDTKPADILTKATTEETWIFFDFGAALLSRQAPYEGHTEYEEIDAVIVAELQTNGSAYGAGSDFTRARLIDGGVAVFAKAGASGTTYTAVARVKTTLNRIIDARAQLRVQNTQE
jgi:hypothetical protein